MLANHAFWKHVLFQSNLQQKDKNGQPRSIRFINQTGAEGNLFHVVDQYVAKMPTMSFLSQIYCYSLMAYPLA